MMTSGKTVRQLNDGGPAAVAAIDHLTMAGLRVSLNGTKLVLMPGGLVTDELRAYAIAHKKELVDHLSEPDGPCPACGSYQWWRDRGGGSWHCRSCGPDIPLTATTLAIQPGPADAMADDRRYCRECQNLAPGGRCQAAGRGEIQANRDYHPVDDTPRRCEGFSPKSADPDQRKGHERWPSKPPLAGADLGAYTAETNHQTPTQGVTCRRCWHFRRVAEQIRT
jgi:hypothetical protein